MESFWPTVSNNEKERRHKNIRLLMEKRGIECLIIAGSSGNYNEKSGELRYISNNVVYYGEGFVIFPLNPNIKPLVLLWSPTQAWWAERRGWFPAKYTGYPYYPDILAYIKKVGLEKARIGLVREDCFPGPVYKGFLEGLPQGKFESFTDEMTRLRLVKSEEELNFQEKAAHLADLAYEAMVNIARPGVKEYEVWAAIEDAMLRNGADGPDFNLICSGPSPIFPTLPASHRTLDKGDIILTELSPSYGGYWVQFCRPVAVGQPDKEFQKLYEVVLEAYKLGVSMLKPGLSPKDINDAITRLIESKGLVSLVYANVSEKGIHMTNASDSVQAALLGKMAIEPGMTFVNHPSAANPQKTKGMLIGDMFVVTRDGARNLNRSPLKLTVIDA
jgi:Xaa-Pro aminopeptidase